MGWGVGWRITLFTTKEDYLQPRGTICNSVLWHFGRRLFATKEDYLQPTYCLHSWEAVSRPRELLTPPFCDTSEEDYLQPSRTICNRLAVLVSYCIFIFVGFAVFISWMFIVFTVYVLLIYYIFNVNWWILTVLYCVFITTYCVFLLCMLFSVFS